MGANDVDVRLWTGRSIRLRAIDQWLVYEGLFDGVPTRSSNAQLVASVVDEASADGRGVVLVPPVETPIPDLGGAGPTEACLLPRTAVRARFDSPDPVSEGGDYSELVVVWFQDPWALPVDAGVLDRLHALDWDVHARDMLRLSGETGDPGW
jgi:hypothetical protein